MKQILLSICIVVFSSCIKDDFVDDFVDPELRITNKVECLTIDSLFQAEALYLNNVGKEEEVDLLWSSSDTSIASVDKNSGLITGLNAGISVISTVNSTGGVQKTDSFSIIVSTNAEDCGVIEKHGTVESTSSYPLSGSYTLKSEGANLLLALGEDYEADNSVPGLYIYLSNNNQSISAALEIGPVEVYNGAHSYTINNVGINDYSYILYFCKPFNVKVGEGVISVN